jgi:hypothetical protein
MLVGHGDMNTLDSQTWLIMDAMADDWESIEQIRPHVSELNGHVSDDAISVTLRTLHDQGLIRIMDDNGNSVSDFPKDPTTCWFSITNNGRTLWDTQGVKYREE